jgi:hypothetical protein
MALNSEVAADQYTDTDTPKYPTWDPSDTGWIDARIAHKLRLRGNRCNYKCAQMTANSNPINPANFSTSDSRLSSTSAT